MGPIKFIRLLSRGRKFVSLVEDGMSKSLFTSKTFWANLLTAGLDLAQVVPLPPGWSVPALAVLNIALRFVTKQPVHIV